VVITLKRGEGVDINFEGSRLKTVLILGVSRVLLSMIVVCLSDNDASF